MTTSNGPAAAAWLDRGHRPLLLKLTVVVAAMFGFGYALVPIYRSICTALGINVLSLSERIGAAGLAGTTDRPKASTQVDTSRWVTVEFDANSRGPWEFRPEVASLRVHPGQMATVMYEFRNVQPRAMAAQAIPSYAPRNAMPHFNKLECFCFNEYLLAPGESRRWPVVFYLDTRLPKDVTTVTLSYTFFEVMGKTPVVPAASPAARPAAPAPTAGAARPQVASMTVDPALPLHRDAPALRDSERAVAVARAVPRHAVVSS